MEEINARRRATWKTKTDEDRNSRQREARQHMTSDEKEQSSTLRRAAYQNMSVEDKEQTNSRRRASEKQNMRAQRNAKLVARRNTPCIESIAMSRPDASNLATPNHMSTPHPFAVGNPPLHLMPPGHQVRLFTAWNQKVIPPSFHYLICPCVFNQYLLAI